jgi:hypothetical protein
MGMPPRRYTEIGLLGPVLKAPGFSAWNDDVFSISASQLKVRPYSTGLFARFRPPPPQDAARLTVIADAAAADHTERDVFDRDPRAGPSPPPLAMACPLLPSLLLPRVP